MNPAETLSLSMSENAGGDTPFATQIAQGTLLRAPIIESISIPAGTVSKPSEAATSRRSALGSAMRIEAAPA